MNTQKQSFGPLRTVLCGVGLVATLSLLVPEVRDEVSHFLSPASNPENPNPGNPLDAFVNHLNHNLEKDGMTLIPAAVYMKYKTTHDYLTSNFGGISTKINDASKAWYVETDFKEIRAQIIQIVESDPILKEDIKQGSLRIPVILKLDSEGRIIIQIRFVVPFQKEEPHEINVEIKPKPIWA